MRQLDVFQSYFDNEGKFLIGRIRFANTDSSPANVYDSNGTAIGTAIQTTNAGRLSREAFLGNQDYLLFFDKWTGVGSVDMSDTESWVNIGSVLNRYNTIGISVETSGVQCVGTMASLKNLNPETIAEETGSKIVCLLGYNTQGDKTPVYYRFDDNSTDNDNGGTIVKPTGRLTPGRWLMDVGDYIDVRDFGAMPSASIVESSAQNNAISAANSVAIQLGRGIHFGGTGYYDITSLNVRNVTSIAGAYLIAKTGTNNTSVYCNSEFVQVSDDSNLDSEMCGLIKIYGSELRSSQDVGNSGNVNFYPTNRMILDKDQWSVYIAGVSLTGVEVVVTAVTHGKLYFTNCSIRSNGKLTANSSSNTLSFDGCRISETMFYNTNVLANCTFSNCILDSWSTLAFAFAVGGTIIDGRGATLSGNVTLGTGSYKNINFTGAITLASSTDASFENCSFGSSVSADNLRLFKCSASNGTITATDIAIYDSTLNNISATNIQIVNSTLGRIQVSSTIKASNVTCNQCIASTIGAQITCDLRNFVSLDSNYECIVKQSVLTGRTINVVGGYGTSTTLGDSNLFAEPTEMLNLKTGKFTRTLTKMSRLETGHHGLNVIYLPPSAQNVGEEVTIYNDSTSSRTMMLWSAVWDNVTHDACITLAQHEVLRIVYLGTQNWKYDNDNNAVSVNNMWTTELSNRMTILA